MTPGTTVEPEAVTDTWSDCLVRMAQAQSRELFLRLYEHFAPRIKSYLIGMGAEEALAEELAQEAMLNVWRKAAQFRPDKATAGTWIFRIARNLRIDQLRRETLDRVDEQDTELPDEAETGPDDLPDHGRLRTALRDLPSLQAQTVYRSYYLGQSHSEIAAELSIPLGSVKSNLRLAFRALRRFLGVSP